MRGTAETPPPPPRPAAVPRPERARFDGAAGAPLAGVYHPPRELGPQPQRGALLLVHCFTCSKDLHITARLAGGLAAAGYAVLRFDFTGVGQSGGRFAATTLTTNLGDLAAGVAALQERTDAPVGLVGHSFGGAACLLAASGLPAVRSIAVLGAPSDAGHVRHLISDREPAIRAAGSAPVSIGGRSFDISADFLDDLDRHEVDRCLPALDRPLLVLHGLDDTVVPVDEGERLFAMARQPKAFVPLIDADHLLTDRRALRTAVAVLAGWFARTL